MKRKKINSLIPLKEDMQKAFEDKDLLTEKVKRMIDLSDDFAYVCDLAAYGLGSSAYGTLLQSKLISMFNWTGINQTKNQGDFKGKYHDLVELKISLSRDNKYNFLNLRLASPVKHYLLIGKTYCDDTLNCFFMPKSAVEYMRENFKELTGNPVGHLRVKSGYVFDDYESDAWSYMNQFAINFDNFDTI